MSASPRPAPQPQPPAADVDAVLAAYLQAVREGDRRAAFRVIDEAHAREPGEIMARTQVRHDAYEVLLDSRRSATWTP